MTPEERAGRLWVLLMPLSDRMRHDARSMIRDEIGAAVAEEREACAKVADAVMARCADPDDLDTYDPVAAFQVGEHGAAEEIAAAIRGRGPACGC